MIKLARDFFEDIETTQKYHVLSNFFELFYVLADSGPEMKRYMVANKFIGRLLDLYKYKTTNNKHYTRDLSFLPTYERICNEKKDFAAPSPDINSSDNEILEGSESMFDFGLKHVKQKISQDDLVVEKAKKSKENRNSDDDSADLTVLKGAKEGDEKRFTYLLRTLSLLVCSCRFKYLDKYIAQDSMFLNSPNPNVVPESEELVIEQLGSDEMIKEFVIRSSLNISTKADINNMYAHLCWENDDVSTRLLKYLMTDI